jgi:hypothetical protein
VNEGDLSKLLGVLFGFNLETKEVDKILVEKIHKKEQYWSIA